VLPTAASARARTRGGALDASTHFDGTVRERSMGDRGDAGPPPAVASIALGSRPPVHSVGRPRSALPRGKPVGMRQRSGRRRPRGCVPYSAGDAPKGGDVSDSTSRLHRVRMNSSRVTSALWDMMEQRRRASCGRSPHTWGRRQCATRTGYGTPAPTPAQSSQQSTRTNTCVARDRRHDWVTRGPERCPHCTQAATVELNTVSAIAAAPNSGS
jgi:hypothetical protein